jgi:hypothetical protein
MKNFKHILKPIACFLLLLVMPTVEVDAQALKSTYKWIAKKVAKESAEEITEKSTKEISEEILQRVLGKNVSKSISSTSTHVTAKGLQEVSSGNIRKTLTTKLNKELSENALKTVSKEFSQQIGKTVSKEEREEFVKRIGKESTLENRHLHATKSLERNAFEAKKSHTEKVKDLYHELKLSLFKKIDKSKINKELLQMYSKGPIELTEKEFTELLKNPQYFNSYIRKTGSKSKSIETKIEFFIRLKRSSHPEYVELILSNPAIKKKMESALRGQGYKHEWLMVKNFKDFLMNPKWEDKGDFLALALPKLVQSTDNVLFKVGGKHGSTNSGKFHNGLIDVIDNSSSVETLFINIRRYAKQNLSPEAYNEFLQILEDTLKAA